MVEKLGRTCWTCKNSGLCYLKRRMDDLLKASSNMLNIDGDVAPGHCYVDLYAALGKSCMLYKERPEDE